MKAKTIASGSKGNCAIVLSEHTNIIIDAGISYLTLKKSLEENSLSFDDFSGILITHCHKDHINGRRVHFSAKTEKTLLHFRKDPVHTAPVDRHRGPVLDDDHVMRRRDADLHIRIEIVAADAPQQVGILSLKANDLFLCGYSSFSPGDGGCDLLAHTSSPFDVKSRSTLHPMRLLRFRHSAGKRPPSVIFRQMRPFSNVLPLHPTIVKAIMS